MSDSDRPERTPGADNFQQLLRICMENTSYTPTTATTSMSEDRREWLNTVLDSLSSNDTVRQMANYLADMKQTLSEVDANNGVLTDDTTDHIETVLHALIDCTSSIDNANDFAKIGGFELTAVLIQSPSAVLQAKTCELLAEVCQNNSICQSRVANDTDLLPVLVQMLDRHTDYNVRVKALYAISCIVRDNADAQSVFEGQLDGFSVLLRAIQSQTNSGDQNKLRIKCCFLITSLCREVPSLCDTLCNMGFVVQLVALLHTDHDDSHEHLLATLYAMASTHEQTRSECRQRELAFRDVLYDRVELVRGKEEFQEELEYCNRLLQLCFSGDREVETER